MIGKSYDGTLANGVAATGVEGLTTIVPISAISQWYEYSRTGGIRHNTNYPGNSLAAAVTNPDRRDSVRRLAHDDERHRRRRARRRQRVLARPRPPQGRRQGARLGVHHPRHPGRQRALQPGHDLVGGAEGARRAAQDVAHPHRPRGPVRLPARGLGRHPAPLVRPRLQGLDNGIMDEPKVDVEIAKDMFETAPDWPVPDSALTDVFLQGTAPASAGALGAAARAAPRTRCRGRTPTSTTRARSSTRRRPAGQPARVPLAAAQDRPAHLRHAGDRHRGVGQRHADQPRRGARRLRPDDAGLAHRRRHRQRHAGGAGLLGRVERQRQRVLREGLQARRRPRHVVARHEGHPRLLATASRCSPARRPRSRSTRSTASRWPTLPARLRVQGRQPDRDGPGRRLHAVRLDRRDGTGRTVTLDTKHEQDAAADRRRATAAAASGGVRGRHRGARVQPDAADSRSTPTSPDGRTVDYPPPTVDRQPGPVADRDLHAAERLDVRGRHDDGHLHRHATRTATRRPARSTSSCRSSTRTTATSTARCPRR